MTTKKARSRRLVRINGTRDPYCITMSIDAGDRETVVRPHPVRPIAYLCTGVWVRRIIVARTRLALHDAILRAGWPSPWREVTQ